MVYDKIVKAERALEMFDFIFLYISFAILFCQKKVKKNCKSAVRVFFKTADIRRFDNYRESTYVTRQWSCVYANMYFSSRNVRAVTVLVILHS